MSIVQGEARDFKPRETEPNRDVPSVQFLEKIATLQKSYPADGNLSLIQAESLTKNDEVLWNDLLVEVENLLKIDEQNIIESRNSFVEYKKRILAIQENVFVGWLSNLITPIDGRFSAQEVLKHSNDETADEIFFEVLNLKERLGI